MPKEPPTEASSSDGLKREGVLSSSESGTSCHSLGSSCSLPSARTSADTSGTAGTSAPDRISPHGTQFADKLKHDTEPNATCNKDEPKGPRLQSMDSQVYEEWQWTPLRKELTCAILPGFLHLSDVLPDFLKTNVSGKSMPTVFDSF